LRDKVSSAIHLKDVSFAYSERQVLNRINLKIGRGEFVALFGPIACGKTTLLMTINGLIPHAVNGRFEGSVQLMGLDTQRSAMRELAQRAGFLFQDPDSQIFSLTVKDEVEFALKNFGFRETDRKKRVQEALAKLSIEHLYDADPNELSQGQKQKVALASILAYDPDVLLLDEPAASLDHKSAEEVYDAVEELNEQGKTVVVVEHDSELIAEKADRLLVMRNGRIELDGEPNVIFAKGIERYGLKEPCFSRIAREAGIKVRDEKELVRKLRSK